MFLIEDNFEEEETRDGKFGHNYSSMFHSEKIYEKHSILIMFLKEFLKYSGSMKNVSINTSCFT